MPHAGLLLGDTSVISAFTGLVFSWRKQTISKQIYSLDGGPNRSKCLRGRSGFNFDVFT